LKAPDSKSDVGATLPWVRIPPLPPFPPTTPGNPPHPASPPNKAPHSPLSEPARRRLWTAGSITALSAHGVRLPAPSPQASPSYGFRNLGLRKPAAAFPEPARWPGPTQARLLSTRPAPADVPVGPPPHKLPPVTASVTLDCGSLLPLSRSQPAGPAQPKLVSSQHAPGTPTSPSAPLPTSPPPVTASVTLDCGSLLPLSRSQPAGPAQPKLVSSQHALSQISNLKSPHRAAGSGLLSELQLSLRTECAYPPPPFSPSPNQPSRYKPASKRRNVIDRGNAGQHSRIRPIWTSLQSLPLRVNRF
jgi:hypothetical protein